MESNPQHYIHSIFSFGDIVRTTDRSVSWGLGPSPLSPLYIGYPALHPADKSLPKPPKSVSLASASGIFSPNKHRKLIAHDISGRPNLIQFFLDRKDFSTHASSTMACVRFLEEFVEWRLISRSNNADTKANKTRGNQEDTVDDSVLISSRPKSFLGHASLKKAASANTLRNVFPRSPITSSSTPTKEHIQQTSASFSGGAPDKQRDMPAAHIFLTPTVRPVDQRRSRPLVNLFTSFVSELGAGVLPMYTTLEEVGGQTGIELFFSSGTGKKKTYWWVWESASWRVVFDHSEKTAVKPSRQNTSKETVPLEVSLSGRPLERRDLVGEASERDVKLGSNLRSRLRYSGSNAKQEKDSTITCGTVKVILRPIFLTHGSKTN